VEVQAMDSAERNVSYGLMMVLFGPVYLVTAIILGIITLGTGDLSNLASFVVTGQVVIGSPGPAYILFAGGLLGVITGMKRVQDRKLAKPYDVVFGVIFSLAGIILIILDIFLGPSSVYKAASTYALIYAFFGLTALYRGVQRMPMAE
jgi:hypothetical protein